MKIVTIDEMRLIEKQADSTGISYSQMMENAGRGIADIIQNLFPNVQRLGFVLALVGPGNNGGDALVALSWLARWGYRISAYLILPRENDELVTRVIDAGGKVITLQQDPSHEILESILKEAGVLLDGLLGTGARIPLRLEYVELIGYVSNYLLKVSKKPFVLAVDCPSGVNCDSGAVPEHVISADLTATMAAIKQGLFAFPAANYIGQIRLVDIGPLEGLPAWENIRRFVVDAPWVRKVLPTRSANAHKGTFGTTYVCAGSVNYTGAAWLAGQAAYRIGAGLVTLALPEPLYCTLAGQFPEATWLILPDDKGCIKGDAANILKGNLGKATALLLGPGWGQEDCTRDFLQNVLTPAFMKRSTQQVPVSEIRSTKDLNNGLPPLILDADGLKLLVKVDRWQERLPDETILTPHPGEMSILTGLEKSEINKDRFGIAEKYSKLWNQIVVLKGAYTVIAEPQGKVALIPVATPSLARAGTGDVLAGLIAGLRAQYVDAFSSAVAGAWIHAQAGLLAEQQLGTSISVVAGDLLQQVPKVLAGIRS